jgi:hypothetical protein
MLEPPCNSVLSGVESQKLRYIHNTGEVYGTQNAIHMSGAGANNVILHNAIWTTSNPASPWSRHCIQNSKLAHVPLELAAEPEGRHGCRRRRKVVPDSRFR